MNKVNDILAEAQRLSEYSKTWADLSNGIFDPVDGLIAKQFPDAADRAAFRKSDAYATLHKLVEQKMQQTGVAGRRGTDQEWQIRCSPPEDDACCASSRRRLRREQA